jgi:hypothetical protein
MTGIDLRATRSHRGGHWFDPRHRRWRRPGHLDAARGESRTVPVRLRSRANSLRGSLGRGGSNEELKRAAA